MPYFYRLKSVANLVLWCTDNQMDVYPNIISSDRYVWDEIIQIMLISLYQIHDTSFFFRASSIRAVPGWVLENLPAVPYFPQNKLSLLRAKKCISTHLILLPFSNICLSILYSQLSNRGRVCPWTDSSATSRAATWLPRSPRFAAGRAPLPASRHHWLLSIWGRSGPNRHGEVFEEVCDSFRELLNNGMRLSSAFFSYAPTPSNRRRDKARAKLTEILINIVQARRSSNHVEDSVLQNLIDSKYKDGRPTTPQEVVGLIIAIILVGQHSSSTSSTWTGAHILNDIRCLIAVIEEQKQVIKKHGYLID